MKIHIYIIFTIVMINKYSAQENISEFIDQNDISSYKNTDPNKKNYEKITMAYTTPW